MKKNIMIAISLILVFTTVLCTTLSAGAAEAKKADADMGKEEVVYAITGADGQLKSVNVVNIFGIGDITDYGDYSDVKMLTSTEKIKQEGDKITFTSKKDRIYYQGTLENTPIPWNITLRYYLNGKELAPEKLAGKSGKLKICFDVTKNAACKGNFYDEFALQATVLLNTDQCKNIVAENATLANVGNDKQLSYTILPRNGLKAVITANVTDFEMPGISINAVKLNLALDVDIDSDELNAKINELMDATRKLNDGAGIIHNGTAPLREGTGALLIGASSLNNGINELDHGIAALNEGIKKSQSGINELTSQSSTLKDGSSKILTGLKTIQSELKSFAITTEKLGELTAASGKLKKGASQLYDGVNLLSQKLSYAQYKSLMAKNGLDIDELKSGNKKALTEIPRIKNTMQQLLNLIRDIPLMAEQAAMLTDLINQMDSITLLLTGDEAAIEGTEQYLNAMSTAASDLKKGAAELKDSVNKFDSAIREMVSSLSDAANKMTQLRSAINELVTNYSKLDTGINAYVSGVSKLIVGYNQLTSGIKSLASASNKLLIGSESVLSGATSLDNGTLKLYEGTSDLMDGTSELYSQTGDIDSQLKEQIDAILASTQNEDTPVVSFVSEKNTNISSVQFVIKTAGIEKPEAPVAQKTEKVKLNFWQKLLRLFGIKY